MKNNDFSKLIFFFTVVLVLSSFSFSWGQDNNLETKNHAQKAIEDLDSLAKSHKLDIPNDNEVSADTADKIKNGTVSPQEITDFNNSKPVSPEASSKIVENMVENQAIRNKKLAQVENPSSFSSLKPVLLCLVFIVILGLLFKFFPRRNN